MKVSPQQTTVKHIKIGECFRPLQGIFVHSEYIFMVIGGRKSVRDTRAVCLSTGKTCLFENSRLVTPLNVEAREL